jgi:endonuclease/exonuclease/phosphatase family metal-dependent hydrolase
VSDTEDPDGRPTPGVGSRIATIVVVAVLAAVGVGLMLLRDDDVPPGPPPPPSAGPTTSVPPAETTVPSPPRSDFSPSRDEPLPELPSVPDSLCPKTTITEPLTVISFNIHGGLGGGLRLDRIAAEIRSWDPDVVLLQEVDYNRVRTRRVAQATWLGEATGLHAAYGGNQPKPAGGTIGNAILSRYPIIESTNTHLPRAGGIELRGLLHAVIDVNGTEVSVYSTHLDHSGTAARIPQARAIATILERDDRPRIIGGDLNAQSAAPPVRIIRATGLGDAWAVGAGAGLTVPAHRPRIRIDFVLHDGWFSPLQARVLGSAVSDHRVVWTRLEFRGQIECIDIGE